MHRRILCLLLYLGSWPALAEPNVALSPIKFPPLPLGVLTFPNGKAMNLTIGVGSGAFHLASEPPGRIWLITDRGPNIACSEARDLIGLDEAAMCGGDASGQIFPLPGFSPTIYGVDVGSDNIVRVSVTLPLKGKSGKPVSGLPSARADGSAEAAFDANGRQLPFSTSGLDTEALVKLADGSFWVADEYGPSLALVRSDGTIVKRLVPKGLAADLPEADYEVVEALPEILLRRQRNRGIEGLAISPDERFIYVMMQSPLANPDSKAYEQSVNVRILKLSRETGALVGEYLYPLDAPESFRRDNMKKAREQKDVRLSEMTAVAEDRLLVLERIEKSSRIYAIDLKSAQPIDQRFDDPATSPSLEQMSEEALAAASVPRLAKTIIVEGDDLVGMPVKTEGMALISDRELILINDNDFSVTGVETRMVRLTFGWPLLK